MNYTFISLQNLKKFYDMIMEKVNSKLNAADISAWALKSTKPTYSAGEITGVGDPSTLNTTSKNIVGSINELCENSNEIESITYYYATTTTQTAPSAESITSTTLPSLSATDKYLWRKEVIGFTGTDDKVTVDLLAVYGDTGEIVETFNTPVDTCTYINGNNGMAAINMTAPANHFKALATITSDNGKMMIGVFNKSLNAYYTANSTIDAGTNAATKSVKILGEDGTSSFAMAGHDHDLVYSKTNHDHDGEYSASNHNHNDAYSAKSHNHNNLYSLLDHDHKAIVYDGIGIAANSIHCVIPYDSVNNKYVNNEVTLGHNQYRYKNLYLNATSVNTGSDRNSKYNIEPFDERHEKAFMDLKPCHFMYKNVNPHDNHDRIHFGLIAQEVEEAFNNNGITNEEAAAICRTRLEKPDEFGQMESYSLVYGEFTSLSIHMIQKLKKEVEALKERVSVLESML